MRRRFLVGAAAVLAALLWALPQSSVEERERLRAIGSGPVKVPDDEKIAPSLRRLPEGPLELLAAALVDHFDIRRQYRDLEDRLQLLERTSDFFRRSQFTFVHRNPLRMGVSAERIFSNLGSGDSVLRAARSALLEGARLLDRESAAPDLEPLTTGISANRHLEQIERLLAACERNRDAAFKEFPDDQLEWVRQQIPLLLFVFEQRVYIHNDPDQDRWRDNARLIRLAQRIDPEPLILNAISLLRLADSRYLQGLRRDLEAEGLDLDREYVLTKATPHGAVRIGGTGNNIHGRLKRHSAVLIDLGGDDFYADGYSASSQEHHASIVVDVQGDDTYQAAGPRDFSQGTGVLGSGLLIDLSGHDNYICTGACQGSGFLGVGALVDAAGNDTYRSHAYAQGTALWGLGLLLDREGEDRYEGHRLCQGVGIAGGVGLLLDHSGDDDYYSHGTYPNSSRSPGMFAGWSQGCGVGFRDIASGGIGVLMDGGGRDRMESGTYSQGAGYYFGWGLVQARGGDDDTYVGGFYSQAAAAHYAGGTFLEEGGDDTYVGRRGGATGRAWDLSAVWFEDRSGDDSYPGMPAGGGYSAHNSVTVWLDHEGTDRYQGYRAPASPGPNDYHGGSSLTLFLDLGGARDRYPADSSGRTGNDHLACQAGFTLFLDTAPTTIEAYLASKKWQQATHRVLPR